MARKKKSAAKKAELLSGDTHKAELLSGAELESPVGGADAGDETPPASNSAGGGEKESSAVGGCSGSCCDGERGDADPAEAVSRRIDDAPAGVRSDAVESLAKPVKISGDCCSNVQDGDGVVDSCRGPSLSPLESPTKPTTAVACCSGKSTTSSDSCCAPKPILVAPAKKVTSCCSPASTDSTCASGATTAPSSSLSLSDRVKALKTDRENLMVKATSSLRAIQVETLRLSIGGMTCSGCCTRIEGFLNEQPGIFGVNVSLLTSRGVVDYDPRSLTPEAIEKLVTTLGFTVAPLPSESLASIVLYVGSEKPERAKQLLRTVHGVVNVRDYSKHRQRKSAVVDLATAGQNSVLVEYDPDVLGARTLVRKLSTALGGFHVQASAPRPHTVESEEEEAAKFAKHLVWSCALTLPVVLVEYIVPLISIEAQHAVATEAITGLSWQDLVGLTCATPILLIIAYPIHESAFLALRFGSRITMDVLISLSSFLAYAFSVITIALHVLHLLPPAAEGFYDETFFEVTALLITLILFGRYIEKKVKARASHSVDALLQIQAKTAILVEKKDNRESYIDVILVERGDLVKVLPGARVPTDGVVVEGVSSVDESMVTGESRKVVKDPGSVVIGGTINAQGVLVVRVTHTVNESMLARIVNLVDEAQSSKCVTQSVADAVSSYFTTFIITVAVVMFVVWYELASRHSIDTKGLAPLPFALRFAITILVISCPCAISLAVPTAIMVGTTIGSQFGVLFKGGHSLEALNAVDVVMFDKTGTLTTGKLQVVDFLVASSFQMSSSRPHKSSSHHHHHQPLTARKLWTYLAAAERNSEHAIARAVVQYARKVHTPHIDAAEFQSVPGCGVRCRVDGYAVCVGSLKWMLDVLRVDVPLDLAARNQVYQREGCVVVCLAIDNALCALVALQDAPRPEAHLVLDQLRKRKIQTWIVTGDQRETALSVARQLGVPDVCVISDALPHQKVDKVRLLQSIGKRVAFVGDGVNDGPALAMAHVGVAVGAGTDVAIESADVVLVKDDLRDLLNALDLSRSTNRLIRWNFTWGFFYNLLVMPIACGALYPFLGVTIPPALAGLSELFSSVPVLLFSLLLNWWRPTFPQTAMDDDDASEGSFITIDVKNDESTPLLVKH